MPRKIGEHFDANGVRETWWEEGDSVTVQRHQDVQDVVDHVAAVNADGAPTVDGLGKPVGEVPLVFAMDWATKRGIPWEKFLYGNQYDAEFKRMIADHSKLAYRAAKTVHTLQ